MRFLLLKSQVCFKYLIFVFLFLKKNKTVFLCVLKMPALFFLNNNIYVAFTVLIYLVLIYKHKVRRDNMSAIFKTIHKLDNRIETYTKHFAFKHPHISSLVLFIGMPICVIAAVFFFTVVITAPIALIFGWL